MSLKSRIKAATPSKLREMELVFRRRKLWRDAGIIFVHVPKNAGSSINDALYGQFMGHVPARLIQQLAPRTFADLPSFALLREPLARCRSAYEFAKVGLGDGDGVIAGMAKPEQYKIPEFDSFERFVHEWLPKQNLIKADPVFRTQASYVCDGSGAVIVDQLGRVEALPEIEGWLAGTLGKTVAIGHTNRTARKGNHPNVSASAQDVIKRIYGQDFELIEQSAGSRR